MLFVFYDERMSVPPSDFESRSPSFYKPKQVIDYWKDHISMEILPVVPAEEYQIMRAHSEGYVRGILQGVVKNGFRNRSKALAASLPWTVGSFLSAAKYAWENQGVACSPTSGFHHAHWSHGHSFCTFNGLMVAVMELRRQGARKIGILDLDAHPGDGTEDILRYLLNSGERVDVVHYSLGQEDLRTYSESRWLHELPNIVEGMCKNCDIILYQAGADPYVRDPLGGLLSKEGLAQRDDIVFQLADAWDKPIVWNLAGGYATDEVGSIQPVLDIHTNTALACVRHFD